MRPRPLLVLCWVQLGIAAALLLLTAHDHAVRPSIECDYKRSDGLVTSVVPGGVAARAGIKRGDRILQMDGIPIAPHVAYNHFITAGDVVPLLVERPSGARETIRVVPITREEADERSLSLGGGRMLSAISSYLWYPLNLWMFSLGIILLVMRGAYSDARLAALFFVYWAGGNFLADMPAIGAMFAPLPRAVRLSIYITDSFFVAAFFAASVHFAMIFTGRSRPPRIWRAVAWILPLPIFIECLAADFRHLDNDRRLLSIPSPSAVYLTLGPALLILSLIILVVRFRRVTDLNARRRLLLDFVALLPGVCGFVIANVLHTFDRYALDQVASIANDGGTFLGSTIFVYAVVRHRMFNIRVLVRRSIQYALARGTLLFAMSLPVIGLLAYLYAHRHDSLAAVLTGTPAVYLLIILPFTLVIRYRKKLLDALDRRFFREQYDARNLMLHVVSMVRDGSDMAGLSRVTLDEIERALHPKHVSLWQLDREGKEYVRVFARGTTGRRMDDTPLPATGALPTLLSTDPDALDLHARATRTLVARLPVAEREWLRDTDAYMLLPLLINDRLVGLMLLGERMSEEPYSSEDRELLRTIGAHLALTFDYARLKGSPSFVWSPLASAPRGPLLDELRSCPVCGRCFAADQTTCEFDQVELAREEGVPRTIEEKYIVTRVLGRGGMGSVYLATQKRLNRPVAVKVLLAHLVSSATMRSRFEREARIVARLRHPAIVTIHDFGVLSGGHAYLVMEYLEGQTLRKTIAAGRQPLQRTMEILRPVGDAIDAAHRAGVVHRDLKPENIMIAADRDGEPPTPRVLDFGLAKMTGPIGDDEATIVQSGQSVGIVGTLMYLAPEILSGHPADARSDQYALGLIAYELLSGMHPFGNATDLAAVVRSHTQDPVTPLRKLAPDVPDHVAAAVHRALEKDADARFASVAEMIEAMGA